MASSPPAAPRPTIWPKARPFAPPTAALQSLAVIEGGADRINFPHGRSPVATACGDVGVAPRAQVRRGCGIMNQARGAGDALGGGKQARPPDSRPLERGVNPRGGGRPGCGLIAPSPSSSSPQVAGSDTGVITEMSIAANGRSPA
jgi:hypothetical protein